MTLMLAACLERDLEPTSPCQASKVTRHERFAYPDRVDLLLVVDNSASMADEQQTLRTQLPNLIRALTSGQRAPGDPNTFPPLEDLHVAVVSTDMGLPGLDLPQAGCRADGGDDGRLQRMGRGTGCAQDYPSFLSYVGDSGLGPPTEPAQFSNDVACMTNLGTAGCSYEQPLEAAFKALWPGQQVDGMGDPITPNEFSFLATREDGTRGRGDLPAAEGGSLGFLRSDVHALQSLIAILLVTDEDDCSLQSPELPTPDSQTPADASCLAYKDRLYDLERYYRGFRKLRPGREELVVFSAIAGVPVDLVSKPVAEKVDFNWDASANTRDAFYDTILRDPRMQELPASGGGLTPTCSRALPEPATAYPARPIVELAKRFGKNGMVQSICQDDWVPALRPIIDSVSAERSRQPCLSRPLVRQANGTVSCQLIWELPATAKLSRTPTQCSQRPYLEPVDPGHAPTNARGGNNCKMRQLPVLDPTSGQPPSGEGWYYDDFGPEVRKSCKYSGGRWITFSPGEKPTPEVSVELECYAGVQKLPNTRADLNPAVPQPGIGSACAALGGDDACVVTLADNTQLRDLFCHVDLGTCVQSCRSESDCPPGWGCDDTAEAITRGGGKGAYCINLACGPDSPP